MGLLGRVDLHKLFVLLLEALFVLFELLNHCALRVEGLILIELSLISGGPPLLLLEEVLQVQLLLLLDLDKLFELLLLSLCLKHLSLSFLNGLLLFKELLLAFGLLHVFELFLLGEESCLVESGFLIFFGLGFLLLLL